MTLLDKVADDALLTPAEVARLFRVSPKTVARWESAGKLRAVKTLGGHRRFQAADVRAALSGSADDR
jgi:excisionase family DNA binding protein